VGTATGQNGFFISFFFYKPLFLLRAEKYVSHHGHTAKRNPAYLLKARTVKTAETAVVR
jgi:hypothetical protein